MPNHRNLAAAVIVALCALLLAGCGSFLGPSDPPPPPPRPTLAAGPAWAPAAAYLKAHPVKPAKGMQVGILVRSTSPGWASQNLNGGAWSGTAVIPGGRAVQLSSDAGDNGMAAYVHVGDLFEFPKPNIPVDAPGDSVTDGRMAKLLEQAVVNVP